MVLAQHKPRSHCQRALNAVEAAVRFSRSMGHDVSNFAELPSDDVIKKRVRAYPMRPRTRVWSRSFAAHFVGKFGRAIAS